MPKMGEDQPQFRETNRDGVEVPRERTLEWRRADKRSACMQQHRQFVLNCIFPERIESRFIGPKAGVHRQQLDPAHLQNFATVVHLVLPAVLRWIEAHEADQSFWILRYILGHIVVRNLHAAESSLAAKYD